MNYDEMIKARSFFQEKLDERIDRWYNLMKTKTELKKSLHNYPITMEIGYPNGIGDFNNAENIHYDFNYFDIECEYTIYYSGCGSEDRSFNIDRELIECTDEKLEQYFTKLDIKIKRHNKQIEQEFEILKAKEEDEKQKKSIEQKKAQYEKLKKEFENN